MTLSAKESTIMSDEKEVVRPPVSFQQAEVNYNWEDKKKKLRAMKVSPLVMRMWEKNE